MKRFVKLTVVQAVCFLAIPLLLMCVNGGVLKSISAYAYHTPMTFAVSLTLASALFLYDGLMIPKRRYNIYIAISLLGVVLFPHLDFTIPHYTFACLFFTGSVFNMIYFSSGKERWFKILIGSVVLFVMLGSFVWGWYSLFWAEWIGMLPISVHFVLEGLGKID